MCAFPVFSRFYCEVVVLFFFFYFVLALAREHWACALPFPRLSLSSWQVFFLYSGMLYACMRALPHKHRSGLCCSIPSTPFSLQALVYLALFLYACFASQTSGLFCSAIPSTPFNLHALLYSAIFFQAYKYFASRKSGLCNALPSTLFSLDALLNSTMLLYYFASRKSSLCNAFPSAVFSLHAFLYSVMFLFAFFTPQTSGLCSAILSTPSRSALCNIQQSSCMRALTQKLRVCAVLFSRPLLICTLCYIQHCSVSVLCLTNIGILSHARCHVI